MQAVDDWVRYTLQSRPYREVAREVWQLYLENHPDNEIFSSEDNVQESYSNVRRAVIGQGIDSTHAQQHQSLFPSEERFFNGIPRNKLSKEYIDQVTALMQMRKRQDNFMINSYLDYKNMMLDGTSAVACPFERKIQTRAEYEFRKLLGMFPMTFLKPKKHYVQKIIYEGTPFNPLQFDDWRIDATVSDFDQTPFMVREWRHPDEIRDLKGFQNRDSENILPYSQITVDGDYYKQIKARYNDVIDDRFMFGSPSAEHLAESFLCLFEKWGNFYIDGEFYENHVLIYSNNRTFHYFGPNPYDHQRKPFIVSPYIPVPGSLLGKSAGKDSIPLAHALDTFLNQAIDIYSRCANPAFAYNVTDSAVMEYFGTGPVAIAPGEGVPFRKQGSIVPFEFNITAAMQTIIPIMQMLKEEIRESMGGVPYTTGGMDQEQNQRTLGEVQILAAGTSTRFQNNTGFYEQAKLEPYLFMEFENMRQFMSEPVWVDKFPVPLTPNLVKQLDVEFRVTGSKSVMDKNKIASDMNILITQMLPGLIQSGFVVPNGDILEANVAALIKASIDNTEIQNSDEYFTIVASPQKQSQEAQNPVNQQLGVMPNGSQPILQAGQGIQAPNMGGPPAMPGMASPQVPVQGAA